MLVPWPDRERRSRHAVSLALHLSRRPQQPFAPTLPARPRHLPLHARPHARDQATDAPGGRLHRAVSPTRPPSRLHQDPILRAPESHLPARSRTRARVASTPRPAIRAGLRGHGDDDTSSAHVQHRRERASSTVPCVSARPPAFGRALPTIEGTPVTVLRPRTLRSRHLAAASRTVVQRSCVSPRSILKSTPRTGVPPIAPTAASKPSARLVRLQSAAATAATAVSERTSQAPLD